MLGISKMFIENNFIYATTGTSTIQKFYENNLALVTNATFYSNSQDILVSNGFVYVGSRETTLRLIQQFSGQQILTSDNQTFYNIRTIKE
jgi:hypothetical protein